jgi:hypothetical protein
MKHEALECCFWTSWNYGLEEETGSVERPLISPLIQFDSTDYSLIIFFRLDKGDGNAKKMS